MQEYGYKPNRQTPDLPAQSVGEELERIRVAAGQLSASAVVDASRPSQALLHKPLDLHKSAKVRAELWSRHKARNLINVVTIVPERPDGESSGKNAVAAFVNIVEGPANEPTYRAYERMEDVLADPVKRAGMVQRALEKLVRVQREFRHLQELSSVWAAIDELVTKGSV